MNKEHQGTKNLIPCKKGEIRNPKGKPKGCLNIKTKIKQMLAAISQDGDEQEPIVRAILEVMQEGGEVSKLKACDMLMDRLEGKAAQKIDNTSSDGSMSPAPQKIELVPLKSNDDSGD